eukprot:6972403-Prymnesium_polylepis.1
MQNIAGGRCAAALQDQNLGLLNFAAPPAAATNRTSTPSPRHPIALRSDTSTHPPPSHELRDDTSSPSSEIDTSNADPWTGESAVWAYNGQPPHAGQQPLIHARASVTNRRPVVLWDHRHP